MTSMETVMRQSWSRGSVSLLVAVLLSGGASPACAQDAVVPRSPVVGVVAHSSGWIGISVEVVEERDGVRRVVITDVWEDSPASEAGLMGGDKILRVNGSEVSAELFRSMTRRLEPEDPMTLVVLRDGREQEVRLRAGIRPGAEAILPVRLQAELDAVRGRLERILAEAAVDVGTDEAGEVVTLRLTAPAIEVERIATDSLITRVILAPMKGDTLARSIVTVGPRGSPEVAWDREWAQARRAIIEAQAQAQAEAERRTRAGARGSVPERSDATQAIADAAPVRPLAPFLTGMNRVAGAELKELSEGLANFFQVDGGLLVAAVSDDTPAAQAGLRAGDVILEFAGVPVRTVSELRHALSRSRAGGELRVVRKGEEMTIRLR